MHYAAYILSRSVHYDLQQWRTSSYKALLQRSNTTCDSSLPPILALFGLIVSNPL